MSGAKLDKSKLDRLCIDTIRFLAAEGVQKAKSGHPGMPIGMAPTAYVLFKQIMKHSPANPKWINRDRFILSGGHGSMLIYSMLHLCGYNWALDDLKNFRQLKSKTAGHPEFNLDLGVEVTTGPLGQGFTNGVGMAIAQKYLASQFNKEGFPIFDYNIYAICGDGDLQEGISSEAASLAGHLGLDNLVVIYDDNRITIDGDTSLSFTEDVAKRFEAYNWNVVVMEGDGTEIDAIKKAVEGGKTQSDKPTLIKLKGHIAYGSPNKQDTHGAHGSPLGDDEIRLMKESFGWDPDTSFHVPDDVKTHMGDCVTQGKAIEAQWDAMFAEYTAKYPDLAKQITEAQAGRLPVNLDDVLPTFEAGSSLATRSASGKVLEAVMPHMPLIMGGSADLTPSNNTWFGGAKDFQKGSYDGRYIRYGIREHAMGSILNAISVSGLLRAYGGTFMVFSDYMRGAMRVAAIAKYPSIFVLTHDSIGVGEDGPTHQPVEHIAALRAMPGLLTFRPADANETVQMWKYVLENADGPVAMCLTRQNLPTLDQAKYGSAKGLVKGAYVLVKADNPDVVLLATGSEVELALKASETLTADGLSVQIVSMPCWELFDRQDQAYKDEVIPPTCKARVAVEAQIDQGWHKYMGDKGIFIGMSGYGISGPQSQVFETFGITTDAVVKAAKSLVG
jgi:transketolase